MIEDSTLFRRQYQKHGLNKNTISLFQKIIKENYQKNKRNLPWRKSKNPYRVLVSEVMLQQTQVPRVIEKYRSWIRIFPDFKALASAPTAEVIREWQGMGYNRRGLFLKKAAEKVVLEHNSKLPHSIDLLENLPGIGPATAASISAFAFNEPAIFVETNVRSVYIHFFFWGKKNIDDEKIKRLLERTLDRKNPSDWYNALMDYGTLLKKEFGNPNKKSRHYSKQGRFEGSNRQLRGLILRLISANNGLTLGQMQENIKKHREVIRRNLVQLEKEGFIHKEKNAYLLGGQELA